MDISRTTVTEIYEKARFKIADCIVNGKMLQISGGNYKLCNGSAKQCCNKKCCNLSINKKGENKMKVAVTYESGNIFQHFGHTENFKIYDIENDKIVKTQIVNTMGNGHGAIVGFLLDLNVDTLICGGIGNGAKNALSESGIRLFGGVSGNADEAVNSLIKGNLDYNSDVHCEHHQHEHSCKEHNCGEDKHGCSGSN